jgi:hypothetical protein
MTKQSLNPKTSAPEARVAAEALEVTSTAEPVTEPAAELEVFAAAAHQPPRLSRSELIRYLLLLFVSSRMVLTVIGLTARTFLDSGFGKQFAWSNYAWLDIWGVWDSFWYMNIAQNGYSTASVIPAYPDQTNFPFFPLYPLLMRLLGELIGGDYFLAGLLISNGCLLLSGYLLYRLVEQDYSRKLARRSLKYLFLFPVSFILSGVFTESLYLCLTLLCFYWAKQQRWWLAGTAGLCLSATRPLGVLIVLPLAVEYWHRRAKKVPSTGEFDGFRDFTRVRRIRLDALFLLLVPVGLLAFAAYNYHVTGDFWFFKTNQAAWNREISNPLTVLAKALRQGLIEAHVRTLLEIGFGIAALLLLSLFWRTIGFSYWLLGMYSILIPLATGVNSLPRFTLPIFPLFIVLAKISQDDTWDDALTISLGLLQGVLMVFWCTGHSLVI